ncbi:hypothetical protein LCGC14_2834330 [marine sediment metagenome]|uniref:Uncharacterized protein n=1 Tax=marine sediment metagenome TaxID=412755 RepID=A0A0F8YD57_9ZZZZ
MSRDEDEQLRKVLAERKRLDPDAPDAIAIRSEKVDTDINEAVERGDARFLILTTDQAEYIAQLIKDNLADWNESGDNDDEHASATALGASVLEQLGPGLGGETEKK